MTTKKNILVSILIALIVSVSGCDSDNSDVSVVDLSLSDNMVKVGQSSVLRIGLEYNRDRNPFEDADDVSLVIKLPAGTQYRNGSAEIQRAFDDKGVNPVINNCDTGEQFLDFRLDGDDLNEGIDPSGDADVEVALTFDAVSPNDFGVIQAKADKNTPIFSCLSIFISDEEEGVRIVP